MTESGGQYALASSSWTAVPHDLRPHMTHYVNLTDPIADRF